MFLWAALIIFIFLGTLFLTVVRVYLWQFRKAEGAVRNAFWERRHRIPLLLSVLAQHGIVQDSPQLRLIQLRDQVSKKSLPFEEESAMEREITKLLQELFTKVASKEELKKDAQWLALAREFKELQNTLLLAIAHYEDSFRRFTALKITKYFSHIAT